MLRHPKWMPRHWMPQHPKWMPRHPDEEGAGKEDTQAQCRGIQNGCRSIQDTRAQCRGMEFGNRGIRRPTKNPESWMPRHWFCEKS